MTQIERTSQDRLRAPAVELPLDPHRWIDESLQLLADHFGTGPLRRAAVVPTEFVPADYDGSESGALEVCLKVCERMEIPSDRLRFSFRLAKVNEIARVMAATMIGAIAAQTHPSLKHVPRDEVAAVRQYSRLLGTVSPEQIAILLDNDRLMAELGGDLRPEVRHLAFTEFAGELERCRVIATEPDPERRAELAESSRRLGPAGMQRGTVAGRWVELIEYVPGLSLTDVAKVEPVPGYTAIMLDAAVLAEPTTLLAVVSHELGHEVLARSGLPGTDGPQEEPLSDLYAVFQGFGIVQANAALDETTLDEPTTSCFGYLGEHTMTDALASYRLRQHALLSDGPLVPAWHENLDPEPRARFLERVRELEALDN